ncbi:MAG: hypothetical protein H6739_18470 [Alphaproteobacteria bacterium]|nr:hypothetical protein [Alphaproteobacteria bacterium]
MNCESWGGEQGVEVTAVYDYNSSGTFSVWGVDGVGNDFCCVVNDPANDYEDMYIDVIRITTYTHVDTISLTHAASGSDLAQIPGNPLEVFVKGDDSGDIITGSNTDHPSYTESLFGESGNDTIDGGDGDDFLYGGVGVDTISGGGGDDYLEGDPTPYGTVSPDVLRGGTGNDTIVGNGEDDLISGGAGDDDIWGGPGEDTICGDLGADEIHGEQDDDTLYGGLGSPDKVYGGADTDACDGETVTSCDSTLSSRPGDCPAP